MNGNFLYSLSKSRKSSTFTFILRVFQNKDILPGKNLTSHHEIVTGDN